MKKDADVLQKTLLQWKEDWSVKQARASWPELLKTYGCAKTVGSLAGLLWNDSADVLMRIDRDNCSVRQRTPPKVLAVYYFRMRDGGIERVLSLLMPLWLKMGYQIILVTEEEATADDYPVPESVQRVCIPTVKESRKDKYRMRAEAWENLIQQYHIDTVMYNAWDSPLLFWDTVLIKSLGMNLIVTVHGLFSYLFTLQVQQRFDVFRAYHLVDCAVVLSRLFIPFWNCYCPSIYIPNPVTLCPPEECSSGKDPVIVWVGRISEEKNPVDAITAFSYVLKERPDARMIMVGAAVTEKIEKEVQQRIQELHLGDRLLLPGYTTDVSGYYKKAKIFLFTSSFEGFGMVLAEAKSHRLPIVMYDLPYLELVKDNRGVITVPQGDVRGLADSLLTLLQPENDAMCQQMAQQARESAMEFAAFDQQQAWQNVFALVAEPDSREKYVDQEHKIVQDLLLSSVEPGERMINQYVADLVEAKEWLEGHGNVLEGEVQKLLHKIQEQQRHIDDLESNLSPLQRNMMRGKRLVRKVILKLKRVD